MAFKILTVSRSASGQTAWTVDEDAYITGINHTASVAISYDKNDSVTNLVGTPTDRITFAPIMSSNSVSMKSGPIIPVLKGEVIYFNSSAACVVQVYLDTVGLTSVS